VYPGGASPLWAEMVGTASRSKGVRREAESEGSVRQNSDSTNRNRIGGRQCFPSSPGQVGPLDDQTLELVRPFRIEDAFHPDPEVVLGIDHRPVMHGCVSSDAWAASAPRLADLRSALALPGPALLTETHAGVCAAA
jgi:hypothetical protein